MNLINTNNTLNQAPIQIATGNSANGNTEIEEQEAINLNKDRVANLRNSITLESADANNTIFIRSTNILQSNVYNDPDAESIVVDTIAEDGLWTRAFLADLAGGSAESILVDTGAGDDSVTISEGRGYEIETGAGNDTIALFGGNSKASTGEDNDYVTVSSNGNELNTGSGNDLVFLLGCITEKGSNDNIIETEEGDDVVVVSGNGNQVNTGEGNDHVTIGCAIEAESILVDTGAGDDIVQAGSGNNHTINTGDGNDTVNLIGNLLGKISGSSVNTGNGDDIITVSKEASGQINGGEGEDTVLLQGKESDYVLEISKDGLTKTYTRNDGAKIVLTDVEKVIIREDVPHRTYGELGKNLIPEDSGSSNDPSGRLDDRPSHRSRDENDLIDRDPFEFRRITHQEILASLEQELEAALNSEDESQKNSIDSLRRQINITKFTINMYEN
jgi:Ca2+-binding RTX toxin-like protein